MRILTTTTLSLFMLAGTAAWAGEPAKPATAAKPAAQDAKAEKEHAAMMEAMKKAGTPGPEHARLKDRAGTFNVAMKAWMAPDQPPEESTGKSVNELVLGDRFVRQMYTGQMHGQPFSGMGTVGFDNIRKKYVLTWTDSMATGIMMMEGTADASGKVITFVGECPDPQTGKMVKHRIVSRMDGPDRYVEEMYAAPKGKEMKFAEIVYTRAKPTS